MPKMKTEPKKDLLTMLKEAAEDVKHQEVESIEEIPATKYAYPVTFADGTTATITGVRRCIGIDNAVLSFVIDGRTPYCATFANDVLIRVIPIDTSK